MKNITVISCLLMLLTLSACKNSIANAFLTEPQFKTIEGRIFDFETKKPVNNVKLYLFFNQTKAVDSVFSDIDGVFSTTFLSFDDWDHQLEVQLPTNYKLANNEKTYRFTQNKQIYLKK